MNKVVVLLTCNPRRFSFQNSSMVYDQKQLLGNKKSEWCKLRRRAVKVFKKLRSSQYLLLRDVSL